METRLKVSEGGLRDGNKNYPVIHKPQFYLAANYSSMEIAS